MNQLVITATFDGEVLKPENPLNLEINKTYKIKLVSQENESFNEDDEKLKQLHQEFDWLIADIGVNQPLTRGKTYED